MREIKFRAWDKNTGRMTHSDAYEKLNLFFRYYDFMTTNRTVELMQYTGLKDKNGKEIYEGDIVELERFDGYANRWLPYMKGATEWSIESGSYLINTEILYNFTARHSEVIGNIYENKELIGD